MKQSRLIGFSVIGSKKIIYLCTRNLFISQKIPAMVIERIENDRIVLNVNDIDFLGIQRLIDYANYLDLTARSKAQSSQVAQLADEVSRSWWSKNKSRLLQ
jgi:hypothetical protein